MCYLKDKLYVNYKIDDIFLQDRLHVIYNIDYVLFTR